MSLKLIVGLRNPGTAYEPTRHNVGGWFVEALAGAQHLVFKADKKLGGDIAQLAMNHLQTYLFMPLSFMNASGHSVRAMAQFYRILPHEILIAHDDLDIQPGRILLKTGGGHGGHNGLRGIITQLGSADFHRLRIGIGHPGHKDLVSDYVLTKPSSPDRQLIVEAIDRAIAIMPQAIEGQMALAMNRLN